MSFSDIIAVRAAKQVIMIVAETAAGQSIAYYFRQVDPARVAYQALSRRGYRLKAVLLHAHRDMHFSDELDPNDPFLFDVEA